MKRVILAFGASLLASFAGAQDAPSAQAAAAAGRIKHFGKGQTETELALPPGRHTFESLFADHVHRSFEPPLHSTKITVAVD